MEITFSGNLLPKNGFFHVDASPTHGCLSAVRSEKILASQMHLPATLNLQSPNKFVRIQIGRVQTHFKIKMLPRANLVMQCPSGERRMRKAMLHCLPTA